MTVITGNRQLAARARDIAERAGNGSVERKAALSAAVALGETRTVPAARSVLAGWDGPAAIKTAALSLLGDLAREAAR